MLCVKLFFCIMSGLQVQKYYKFMHLCYLLKNLKLRMIILMYHQYLKFTTTNNHICLFYHRTNPALGLKASMDSPRVTQELADTKQRSTSGTQNGNDLFNEMKHRFLSFKRHKYQYELCASGLRTVGFSFIFK